MTTEQSGQELVGRGNREGAALFKDWFAELGQTAANGGQAAYVFVMGSLNEILKSFDLPVVFPEINSLQTAVRRVAHEYLDEAEDYGYSPDICGYVKADVAVQLRGGQHPMGQIPATPASRCSRTHATPTSSGPRSGSACTKRPPSRSTFPAPARQVVRPGRETPTSRPTAGTSRSS